MSESHQFDHMVKDPAGPLPCAGLELDALEGHYDCKLATQPGPKKSIIEKELFLPCLLF